MNNFSKKNKIIIILCVSIILSLGIYFVYSKTDETQIFSYEDGIEKTQDENNKSENIELNNKIEEKNKIVIHISGSIANEGILELDENSRISNQTTPNMIQRISRIFERNPLISKEI